MTLSINQRSTVRLEDTFKFDSKSIVKALESIGFSQVVYSEQRYYPKTMLKGTANHGQFNLLLVNDASNYALLVNGSTDQQRKLSVTFGLRLGDQFIAAKEYISLKSLPCNSLHYSFLVLNPNEIKEAFEAFKLSFNKAFEDTLSQESFFSVAAKMIAYRNHKLGVSALISIEKPNTLTKAESFISLSLSLLKSTSKANKGFIENKRQRSNITLKLAKELSL